MFVVQETVLESLWLSEKATQPRVLEYIHRACEVACTEMGCA